MLPPRGNLRAAMCFVNWSRITTISETKKRRKINPHFVRHYQNNVIIRLDRIIQSLDSVLRLDRGIKSGNDRKRRLCPNGHRYLQDKSSLFLLNLVFFLALETVRSVRKNLKPAKSDFLAASLADSKGFFLYLFQSRVDITNNPSFRRGQVY